MARDAKKSKLDLTTTTNTTIVTSNGITNTSHMPTHCKCIDSTIFSKTSSNVGNEVMNELKQNISHYDRVKSYSTGFLVNMVDVNTITYTIGYLSKLLSENNGKSCDICGDCLVFARIHNMLPYQESFDALTPMMAKITKLNNLIGKIPSDIVGNQKMIKCFLGLLDEKRSNF
ncbi:hypothetical protein ACTFIZ_012329 [Dictyostelium cf. discoideum]